MFLSNVIGFSEHLQYCNLIMYVHADLLVTGRKLNLYKTFRKGCLMYAKISKCTQGEWIFARLPARHLLFILSPETIVGKYFVNIYRTKLVLDFFFNKVSGLRL